MILDIIWYFAWLVYLSFEGLYDAWIYRFTPVNKRKVMGIHVIHAIALSQRLLIAVIISTASTTCFWQMCINFIGLWLAMPLIQTGFYMTGQAVLSNLFKLPLLRDEDDKPYGFFGRPSAASSLFPDKNPLLRLAYFIIGIIVYFFINIC